MRALVNILQGSGLSHPSRRYHHNEPVVELGCCADALQNFVAERFCHLELAGFYYRCICVVDPVSQSEIAPTEIDTTFNPALIPILRAGVPRAGAEEAPACTEWPS